ncbi:hypothetical protein K2173_009109 [Erythroxylum novogranatense]|uniref:RING-type E3 ubiquitin transferase n=1 Tax=Erythroxylum novogranatense TaxID=1862640 RepID=A0AAV8TEK4_9ROSI|nr:hypothetical protein K2173_009109 [Erythroxylum novogranatense]
MGLQYRRLLPSIDLLNNNTLSEICKPFCDPSNELGCCEDQCLDYCSIHCPSALPPSPSGLIYVHHAHKLSKFLITIFAGLATAFVLVCCYGVYLKWCSGPRRRRRRSREQRNQMTHDEFIDEDHGPVIDHPIWYINTVGLQPSVISSIAVFKYRKGDGPVEGTECSVCLNEFQEDETLRLLPKCSHAFHIPCIDTWLRSHTNCPLCRSPIVTSSTRPTTTDSDTNNSSPGDESRAGMLLDDAESSRGRDGGDGQLTISTQEGVLSRRKSCEDLNREDSIQPMRRSVSMNSLSAFRVTQALTVLPEQSDGNPVNHLAKIYESDREMVQSRMGGHHISSIMRSLHIRPSSLKRSFSCSGKLFLSRYRRGRNSPFSL